MKSDNEKLLIYPYGKEFAPIVRNRSLLRNYEIIDLISPLGWGMDGRDASLADKGTNIGILVHSDFEESLAKSDTMLVADCCVEKDFKSTIYKNIRHALDHKKNVICTLELEEAFIADAEKLSSTRNVYFKYYDKTHEFDKKMDYAWGTGYLEEFEVPIVFIGGVSENTAKFEIQLSLRNLLLEKGYKISQIGSRHYCELLGFHSMPSFMYEPGLSDPEKIIKFNHYVRSIYTKENPDIIIIGIPGDIVMLDSRFPGNFGTMSFLITNAVRPDFFIFSAFYADRVEQLIKIKKFIENRMGFEIDCINISNTQFDLNDSTERMIKCYNYLPQSFVDNKIDTFREEGISLINIFSRQGKEEMVNLLIDTLSGYCTTENICIGGM